jgi:hypothetical protein
VRCYSPSLRPAAFPPPSPPPICGRLCSRLHRYYAAVRLLTSSAMASPPRLPVVARSRLCGLGEMRSPRFRRVPFIRNGVSDHGRAVTPRIPVRLILPSAFVTASASATSSLSRLNIPLRMIAVYASCSSSPTPTQHSLQGGSLGLTPGRTFTGWTAPASPGARSGRGPGYPGPPAQIPACGFPAPGSCRRSNAIEVRGFGGPYTPDPQARSVGDTPHPALSPGRALLLAFPSAGRLPSTISAADLWSALFEASQVLCSRPTPHLFRDGFASSASRRGPVPPLRFGRDEVSQVPTRSLHT